MQIQIVYSINVEKTCKKSTEDFLLNVESIGNEVRTSFIQKCVENPNRFDERIKKDKIHNFATDSNPKSNLQNYIDSHFLQFHRHQPMEL